MTLTIGKRDLDYPGPYTGDLRDATPLLGDADALHQRLDDDGYLLLRGLLNRDLVLETRRQMTSILAEDGALEPGTDPLEAVVAQGGRGNFMGGENRLTQTEGFGRLVASPEVMGFFEGLRGGPIRTYDYQWLRVVAPGEFTGAHYDIVYMGRGTPNVLTCWIPLGAVPLEHGPLCVLSGSHRLDRIKATYGKMDVDRDHVVGWFSTDPKEVVDQYGGQWLTTEFEPGDVMVFGMYTMHGSVTNTSDRYRISSDTRYQLATEPVDDRWVGRQPKGHYAWTQGPTVPMEEARARWGV